jgi:hypothetical protein
MFFHFYPRFISSSTDFGFEPFILKCSIRSTLNPSYANLSCPSLGFNGFKGLSYVFSLIRRLSFMAGTFLMSF